LGQARVFNEETPAILIVIEFKLEEFIANGNSIADMSGRGFSKLLNPFLHLITKRSGRTVPNGSGSYPYQYLKTR
jgi:hypothetical protein